MTNLALFAATLFAGSTLYHKLKKRTWAHALHYAAIFAIAVTLLLFVSLQIGALAGFLPTNRDMMGS
ncbi:MAG: hypothetical protein AAFV62_01455 [Pseudomonadota bacterium]